MKRILPILLLTLSGCVSVRTGIVVDREGQKSPLIGESLATLTRGDFSASTLDGYTCGGTYDQFTQSPSLKVDVKCSDGRYGKVIVLRTGPSLTNGSGEGRLNDGTRFKVLLGDMAHYSATKGIWADK